MKNFPITIASDKYVLNQWRTIYLDQEHETDFRVTIDENLLMKFDRLKLAHEYFNLLTGTSETSDFIRLAKGSYINKDGDIKEGLKFNGEYYAPKLDLHITKH